jgi:hypothetical protein
MQRNPEELGRRDAGLTIIDVTIAMGVLAVVMILIVASMTVTTQVRRYAAEKDTASEAMKSEVARIKSLGLEGALTDFRAASQQGHATFDVPGLGKAKVQAGSIALITDETLTDEELGISIGMPMDLDGDGFMDNQNTSVTATLVPVIATVTWEGVAGPSSLKTVIMLHRPKKSE